LGLPESNGYPVWDIMSQLITMPLITKALFPHSRCR
jgi:hypothetical protein